MIYKKIFKRIFDVMLATAMQIFLLIPLLFVALIIKITSKGPVFFVQERFGISSKPFKLYKFRSMVVNTPDKANSEFTDIKSYVTPFGNFMRKTSIDELPQLINIIKGDMSFIGPRPLSKADLVVVQLRKQNGADQVLPGISGLAQVNGRNNITDEDKAKYDALYAESISFRQDLKLFFDTIISVFRKDDIYKEFKPVEQKENKSVKDDTDSIIHPNV